MSKKLYALIALVIFSCTPEEPKECGTVTGAHQETVIASGVQGEIFYVLEIDGVNQFVSRELYKSYRVGDEICEDY